MSNYNRFTCNTIFENEKEQAKLFVAHCTFMVFNPKYILIAREWDLHIK